MTTFGIYLIHDNNFIRPYIWEVLLKIQLLLILFYYQYMHFVTIMVVFIVCSIIDYLRIILFERPIFQIVDRKWIQINNCGQKIKKFFFNKTHLYLLKHFR
jgi:hypothetical protein